MQIALPLILSTGSISVLLFSDRMLLSWHSKISLAAAVPAGMFNFSFLCIFMGTVSYTGTFVAQYFGAKQKDKIGQIIWHGIYIATLGAIIMPIIGIFSPEFFAWVGHAAEVQAEEVQYFRILNFCALPFLANATLSSFFSGRGKTWTIMRVNFSMMIINIVLDYIFIFGKFSLPEFGIRGAGYATFVASVFSCLVYIVLIAKPANSEFQFARGWVFKKDLISRFIKYGLPAGVHFFIDVMGFTFFMLLVGRIGANELAASNVAMQINLLGLLPLMGLGITANILVGKYIGAKNPEQAAKTALRVLKITLVYISFMSLMYALVPQLFINPFGWGQGSENFAPIFDISKHLLKYIAVITLFDALSIICSNAIKGAGDTRFVMRVILLTSIFVLLLPSGILTYLGSPNIFAFWKWATLYVGLNSLLFFLRFKKGVWKSMSIIGN